MVETRIALILDSDMTRIDELLEDKFLVFTIAEVLLFSSITRAHFGDDDISKRKSEIYCSSRLLLPFL